jgi:hypothetical protein
MTQLVTAVQLSTRLNYSSRHINEYLKDRVFIEGIHYVKLPGSRRILYIWDAIDRDLIAGQGNIQMANGSVCHG